jgi:hypothetical protein
MKLEIRRVWVLPGGEMVLHTNEGVTVLRGPGADSADEQQDGESCAWNQSALESPTGNVICVECAGDMVVIKTETVILLLRRNPTKKGNPFETTQFPCEAEDVVRMLVLPARDPVTLGNVVFFHEKCEPTVYAVQVCHTTGECTVRAIDVGWRHKFLLGSYVPPHGGWACLITTAGAPEADVDVRLVRLPLSIENPLDKYERAPLSIDPAHAVSLHHHGSRIWIVCTLHLAGGLVCCMDYDEEVHTYTTTENHFCDIGGNIGCCAIPRGLCVFRNLQVDVLETKNGTIKSTKMNGGTAVLGDMEWRQVLNMCLTKGGRLLMFHPNGRLLELNGY